MFIFEKIDNEFDIDTQEVGGGYKLIYAVNKYRMDVRILRSDIFMTVYFLVSVLLEPLNTVSY